MNRLTMIAQAKSRLINCGQEAEMGIVVPGRWPAKGNRKRLNGRSGPWGECSYTFAGGVLCFFKASEVLAYAESLPPGA